ncbi:MAG: hypothetical protein FJX02_12940 [Alphaproteobacteria bacterium]|nr:hypothetical protein [Alphaproteobacteria bacterium]
MFPDVLVLASGAEQRPIYGPITQDSDPSVRARGSPERRATSDPQTQAPQPRRALGRGCRLGRRRRRRTLRVRRGHSAAHTTRRPGTQHRRATRRRTAKRHE